MAAAGGTWSKGQFKPAKGSQQAPTALSAPDRDPVSQQYFTQENIQVKYSGLAKYTLTDVLGRDTTDTDIARLSGAPNGALISVVDDDGQVRITVKHPFYPEQSERILYWDGERAILKNENLNVEGAPPGFGTRIFATQVRAAEELGVSTIETFAGGSAQDPMYNGYYTWARLGYNAILSPSQRNKAAFDLGSTTDDIVDIHSLFAQPQGAGWWKKNGKSKNMEFDPRTGSTSRQVLDAYLDYKGYTL